MRFQRALKTILRTVRPASPASGERIVAPGRRSSAVLLIAAACWLFAVIGAVAALAVYSNRPGDPGTIPLRWPSQSQIPLDAHKPTLVFLAHPRCPCTRASLGELELLMARSQGLVSAHVVFIRPEGTAQDWVETDLWRTAAAIPGVTVHRDDEGSEAHRFGSATSGQTLVYEPDGRLVFQGGITIERGHAGDNPGRSGILALLRHETTNPSKTPVFGCSLFAVSPVGKNAQCQR